MQHQAPASAPDDLLGLTVQVSLKRVGCEMRMLVENADDQTAADPSLLRIIARAHHIQALNDSANWTWFRSAPKFQKNAEHEGFRRPCPEFPTRRNN